MLEIRLLGEFDVRLNGQPVEIPSRPAQSLLAYLALNPETKHRREKLAGLLWSDSEETNARSNLRHALWRLRKAIGEEYFDADKVTIAFKALEDCELDVYCLEVETKETETLDGLINAVSVYGGDLLPGFYESWVVLERERLKYAFEHVVQRLLDLLIEAGSWLEVLEWGERWIALGHVPEPAFRALMTAYSALGDSSGLAAVYQRCCDVLKGELGVEPSEQTRSTYEWLTKGGDPTAVSQAYVGREVSSATAIQMLLKQWREKGVEILELASLAMVHAARTDEPYEPKDASLLIRSALHHEVDVKPWIKRTSSPQVAVAALNAVLEGYPKPSTRMRIVEELADLKGQEAEEALLQVVDGDDSSAIRSEAAVAAAHRGLQRKVVELLLDDLNKPGEDTALAALAAVADEIGLPEDIGPYPKLPVFLGFVRRRWQFHRDSIRRQVIHGSRGAALYSALIGATSPFFISITSPDSFRTSVEVVPIAPWILLGAFTLLVIGGVQGAASSLAVGLADVIWDDWRRGRRRILLGIFAGLVFSGYLILFTSLSLYDLPTTPAVFIPVYLVYGLVLGAMFSFMIPQLGSHVSLRGQLPRFILVAAVIGFATIFQMYFSYRELDIPYLIFRALFPIMLALGLGLSLREVKNSK
jgi:DNA-binding SARP family transcriptional activator